MTRAISRDSFNELKQYIGVHLQQGRVILDSDWNEGQDIMATLARRLGQDAFGDGVLGEGFEIQPVIPSPWKPGSQDLFELSYFQGHLPVSMRFPPSAPFDTFESIDGWALEGPGKLRISRDQPYEGRGFLRLSDHTGEVTVAKTLASPTDLSAFQYGHFRFRLNHDANVPSGAAKFFIEDTNGNRNLWPLTAPWAAKERWFPGAALPLDLRFHLFDIDLLPAFARQPYSSVLPTFPTAAAVNSGVTFSLTGNRPPWLNVGPSSGHSTPYYGVLTGFPTEPGAFTFTVNATTNGTTVSRTFTLMVLNDPTSTPLSAEPLNLSSTTDRALDFWKMIHARPTTKGTAANLSSIKRYGFIISPQGAAPAVWDFDALHFSSRSNVHAKAADNFVISGPATPQLTDQLIGVIQTRDFGEEASDLLSTLAQNFSGSTRAFVNGHACNQPRDLLYSDQRDPHDPPVTAPSDSSLRKDLVYLDVTREPVTYIHDPDLREIALGGPDTSTRMRIRQRVRVATDGLLPANGGTGSGRLATEGNYTDRANRLYLVEVDTAGDIGTATVRWSDDNGSTLQRVIEPVPTGSTKITVEDASSFRPGDFILLRTEFMDEEHRVATVTGNTITLQATNGVSSTFALADRLSIQRWNSFRAPIIIDPNDSTISAPLNLSHGVAIRISGRALRKGDFWTFRTRYLAGDGAFGSDSTARIEILDFTPPQGVIHHYTPLAQIIRDPHIQFPDRVQVIRDQRRRAGQITLHQQDTELDLAALVQQRSDFLFLGSIAPQSALLCLWSGVVRFPAAQSVTMKISIEFFGNTLTTSRSDEGRIGEAFDMSLTYDDTPITRNVFTLIPRLPGSGVVAARATYTAAQSPSPVEGTSVRGILTLIEFKNPLRNISIFPLKV